MNIETSLLNYIFKSVFSKQDIYVLVEWENTLHRKKPKFNKYKGNIKSKRNNEWVVQWEDTWIELSELNGSCYEWRTYYKNIVFPQLQDQFNVEDCIIIP